MIFKSFLLIASLVGLAYCKSIETIEISENIVWFPDPKSNDGSVILAKLTPDENAKVGDEKDVHFLLYTKNDPSSQEEIEISTESISASKFIQGGKLKILIHGFGGDYDHTFPWDLGNEYLSTGIDNVIFVDWSVLAEGPDYFTAVANAQLNSDKTARLIDFLVANDYVQIENVHIIGYSLGGQVVGQIGKKVSNKLPRITALDPALPLFDVAHEDNRTTPDDADFVEVIHTAANGILGYYEPCGHIDFYPNGGRYQPGCGIDVSGSCAHARAPAMYTESVSTQVGFTARKCESYEKFLEGGCADEDTLDMGVNTPVTASGLYYLRSNSESPFALGSAGAGPETTK